MPEKITIIAPRTLRYSSFLSVFRNKINAYFEDELFDGEMDIKKYFATIDKTTSAIVWRRQDIQSREYNKRCNNILFVDYGLLTSDTVYVDHLGFGGASSLVLKEENIKEINAEEQINLHTYLSKGHNLYKGKTKDGPVVVCISPDKDIVKNIADYVPKNLPLIFVEPPYQKESLQDIINPYLDSRDWVLTVKDASSLIDISRAVITNLDHPAAYAVILGKPTATIGRGLWSGSSCVLSCENRPRRLKTILAFDFDEEAANLYLAAIFRHQLNLHSSLQETFNHPSVIYWIRKINRISAEGTIVPV